MPTLHNASADRGFLVRDVIDRVQRTTGGCNSLDVIIIPQSSKKWSDYQNALLLLRKEEPCS